MSGRIYFMNKQNSTLTSRDLLRKRLAKFNEITIYKKLNNSYMRPLNQTACLGNIFLKILYKGQLLAHMTTSDTLP
jgi:hypothetical protein